MNNKSFERGHRVITPDGEGEVLESTNIMVKVKLDNGEIKTYDADTVEDTDVG